MTSETKNVYDLGMQDIDMYFIEQFHGAMISHIEFYTVGQYKDYPEDEATHYSVADCIFNIRRYSRRYGTSARTGEERLDMLKIAHYAAIAAMKIHGGDPDAPELCAQGMSYRAREWCTVYRWLEMASESGDIDIDPDHRIASDSTPDVLMDGIRRQIEAIDCRLSRETPAGVRTSATIGDMLQVIFLAASAWLKTPYRQPEQTVPHVRVRALHSDARLPAVQTDGSAGADLTAVSDHVLLPGERALVRTGIALELPAGYEGQVRSRGGVSSTRQLVLLNGVGTVDADYRGEVMVPIKNLSKKTQSVFAGERIAQLLIKPAPRFAFCWAPDLSDTVRGAGGFGSTGTGGGEQVSGRNGTSG